MVYCYPIEDDGHYNITAAQLQLEDRAVGGDPTVIVTGYGNEPGRVKSVAEEEDVGLFVDVGVAEEVPNAFPRPNMDPTRQNRPSSPSPIKQHSNKYRLLCNPRASVVCVDF
jgi:hypothetical protein